MIDCIKVSPLHFDRYSCFWFSHLFSFWRNFLICFVVWQFSFCTILALFCDEIAMSEQNAVFRIEFMSGQSSAPIEPKYNMRINNYRENRVNIENYYYSFVLFSLSRIFRFRVSVCKSVYSIHRRAQNENINRNSIERLNETRWRSADKEEAKRSWMKIIILVMISLFTFPMATKGNTRHRTMSSKTK